MKNRRLLFCLFAVCVAVSVAGCGPKASDDAFAPDEPARKVIGCSLLTQTHVFYQDLVASMEEAAKEHGFQLDIQYCESDGAKQNDQLETFMIKGVDALVVSPNDSAGIAPVVADAQAKGIPVFTVDIAAEGCDVVSHIASDNVMGGRILGEYLAELLDGKGEVAIVDHPEVASVKDRVAGFEEALANFPDITISAKVPGQGLRLPALEATQDLLESHPNLNAIFGINDDSALGALAAVEAAGREDSIIIVGYDGTPEARKAIQKGSALKADTVQFPKKIGAKAIEIIAKHLNGEDVPKISPVEVDIIDKAALDQGEGA